MGIEQDYDIENVFRRVQMMEFGEMVFKIYEEQYKDIREAYKLFERLATPDNLNLPPERVVGTLTQVARTYHTFFQSFYKACDERSAAQAERKKKEDEEFERVLERINAPKNAEAMREFADSFNEERTDG